MSTKSKTSRKPAATVNAATQVNSAIPPKANDPHVIAARNVKDAAAKADGALVAALLLAITDGRFEPSHLIVAGYPEGTAKVYASEWNVAARVASIIGEKAAQKLVNDTAKLYPLGTYRATLAALRNVKDEAREQGVKDATPAQTRALVKDAPKAAKIADEKRREHLASMRGKRDPNAGTMAERATQVATSKSWGEGAASLRLIANTLNGAAVPEGMEAQARTFLKALGDAVEAGQPFLRKVAKA